MQKIDYHLIKRSLTGMDDECGDTGIVRLYDDHCFMALIDVLGHGKAAFDVAVRAETWLLHHYQEEQKQEREWGEERKRDLTDLMTGLHDHLKGSRGAVATLCRLNLTTGELRYSGIGNICTRLFGNTPQRLMSKDGIIGYMMSSPMEKQVVLYPGDILVMSSDGVKEHVNMDEYPELLMGSTREITTRFINQFGKKDDDASCLALRYGI